MGGNCGDLLQAQALEEVIKSIIRPEIEEGQVLQKKKMWMEMRGGLESEGVCRPGGRDALFVWKRRVNLNYKIGIEDIRNVL